MTFNKTKLISKSINQAASLYLSMIERKLDQVNGNENNTVVVEMLSAFDSVEKIIDKTIKKLFHVGNDRDNEVDIDLLNNLRYLRMIAKNNTSNCFINIYLKTIINKIDNTMEDNYNVFKVCYFAS